MRHIRQLAKDVAGALHLRGIVFDERRLQAYPRDELSLCEQWALAGMPWRRAPGWLNESVAIGRAHRLRGICRDCGCTEDRACPGGCAWADISQTLCTACVAPDTTQPKASGS